MVIFRTDVASSQYSEKQGFWSLYTLGLADTIELSSLELRFPVAALYQNTSLLEEANE